MDAGKRRITLKRLRSNVRNGKINKLRRRCLYGIVKILRRRGPNGLVDHSQSYFMNAYNYATKSYNLATDIDDIGESLYASWVKPTDDNLYGNTQGDYHLPGNTDECIDLLHEADDSGDERKDDDVEQEALDDRNIPIGKDDDRIDDNSEHSKCDTSFPVGSVVWAKFGKTQWWPGLLIEGRMVKQEVRWGHVWIYWLSDRKISQVKCTALEPFSKHLLRFSRPPIRRQMLHGIRKALQITAERCQADISCYGEIEEWVTDPNGFYKVINKNSQQMRSHEEMALPDFVIDDLKKFSIGKDLNTVVEIKLKPKERKKHSPSLELPETCLACRLGCSADNQHPLFEGYLCQRCKPILKKNMFSVDYDEYTLVCVVCGEGGFLVVCDNKQCGKSFCFPCIVQYKGHVMARKIEKQEDWSCFLCQGGETYGGLVPRTDRDTSIVNFFTDLPLCRDLRYLTNAGKRKIRVLSLFDGIGTGKVVLDELGFDIDVYFTSEINKDAIEVTQHNYKNEITEIGDAWKLQKQQITELCPLDLVLAGPPCNDLSIVNPKRKGFSGSGLLVVKFIALLRDIETVCKDRTHVFWMMENTGSMLNSYKRNICSFLDMQPASWDAKHFSGQRRYRNFWGNIPGMFSTPDVLKQLERDKKDLTSVLTPNHNRTAVVECTRTITSQPNSLTITNGKDNKLVLMDGKEDGLWTEEIERLFGFKTNYTQTGGLSDDRRRKLLGRAWSVPVVKQILAPLTKYFKLKQTV